MEVFFAGDEGVLITVVAADPDVDSRPANENVNQYSWTYDGGGLAPYGLPEPTNGVSLVCALPVTAHHLFRAVLVC